LLDLHHQTTDEARVMVRERIQVLARQRRGCLLHIITGKGNHSPNGSRLKPAVDSLLKGELRGFIEEHDLDVDGGGFLVRLR
jgi:DNA-nicking Smr family endonuclease